MPVRLIIILVVATIILRVARRVLSAAIAPASKQAARRPRSSQMVRCAACGTFVTEKSALVVRDRDFCSPACAGQSQRA
jgi:hypothetical protein